MAYSGNPKDYAVAVLYGGTSGEREVSLNSGKCCGRALEEKGFSITLLDPASRDDLKRLIDETFDVAFLALHGKGGEDGTLQGFLETLGIPYTGSGILANAIAINKGKSKELYESAGLRVAASVLVGRNDVLDDADRQEIVDTCGIPCVVKPSTEGSSLGMTIVRDAGDLQAALDTALAVDDEAMVEQFIDGIELTVGVMGSDDPTAFPVIQILSNDDEFYNYHAKYAAGGSTRYLPCSYFGGGYRAGSGHGRRGPCRLGMQGHLAHRYHARQRGSLLGFGDQYAPRHDRYVPDSRCRARCRNELRRRVREADRNGA